MPYNKSNGWQSAGNVLDICQCPNTLTLMKKLPVLINERRQMYTAINRNIFTLFCFLTLSTYKSYKCFRDISQFNIVFTWILISKQTINWPPLHYMVIIWHAFEIWTPNQRIKICCWKVESSRDNNEDRNGSWDTDMVFEKNVNRSRRISCHVCIKSRHTNWPVNQTSL